ncbi:MAG TPA: N-acetylmuramoyl-L-alanine amidase [Rhabdochlamydiaceae bacterium]|nr:N-acetylmuramoyl-L-alanine amidase [Rhabdochlamydiaceae bacterium]
MFYLLIVLFFPLFIWGKSFSDFDLYQKKLTREVVQRKIDAFLKKDPGLDAYYQLGNDSLILYKTPKTQKNPIVDYVLQFDDQLMAEEKKEKKESLSGVKIAIDPGHFGGSYAFLEERFISIGKIQFDEGTLNLLTALYLKQLLEQEGAIVLLTKERAGKGVFEEDFFDWLKKTPQNWMNKTLNKIFRNEYNPLDLRARAEKINEFRPDLTVIIHFNSHHAGNEMPSNHFVTDSNYNLVFVPGAFCKDELEQQDARYEFMRLICTNDLKNSFHLSQSILDKFSEILKVPVVEEADDIGYLQKCCIKVEEGIFARNLALTRLIHGPLCYGETLIQNNKDEYKILGKKDFEIGGIRCSARLKQVAEAYFEGIKSYLRHHLK